MIKSDLFKTILPLIKNKNVLDVGCVEHNASAKDKNPFWIHNFLRDNSNVLGIDILEKEVNKLKSKGYNIEVDNAETFSLTQTFDVVFAGELIEHLSNPGLFLNRAKKHLRDNGLLILTTPNTFYSPRLAKCIMQNNDDPIVNKEHTFWFSPTTIKELLRREGFKVLYIKRFDASGQDTIKSKIKTGLNIVLNKKIKGSLLVVAKLN